jgi:PAS domain S-box-containing protein
MAAVHPSQDAAVFEDSGQLYRLIADTIPLMVWTARADGEVDFVNQRVLEYTGLASRELEGWGWKKVVHPDDWERCLAVWTQALESGERSENEMRLRRADGEYRWHHGSGVPLRDAAGRVLRWFGIATDIQAEERTRALREAQARLRALIDNEPECVKLLDAQGCLLEMNAAGLRMIEAERAEEVLGKCVYGIVAPEHVAAFRDLTERVCRDERGTLQFELVGLRGTRRWMETHAVPFRDEASGETRLLGITRDITDRRRAEQALLESEQRFRSFMDNAPAVAWIKDASFRYTYVNRMHKRVFGRSLDEMLGRDDFEIHPESVARELRSHDEAALHAAEGSIQTEETVPYSDNTLGRWLVVKFPLADASGKTGIAGIAVDITDRTRLEEKARQYAEDVRNLVNRLVQAQESERRRVADELHDLIGQNLTALGIDLQALKQRLHTGGDLIAGPRLDAMAGLVETTIDAIRGVMTDLRPAALEEFGLVPALRWYASLFSKRTGMKVSTNVSGRELRLPRDTELALFRIVQEALTNAAKHSGGTAVEIAIRYGEGLRLTVKDDGRGFAEPVGARSARRGGFGLPTMRERAEAHGATLRVEFPERGTRLVVDMPAKRHAD